MENLVTSAIEIGVAALPLPGQQSCGDLHLCTQFSNGVLIAALDGIGHGAEAANASRMAVATIEAHAGEPLMVAVKQCHEALRSTRGVVMSMACFNVSHNMMTWIGLGNVEGVLLRAHGSPSPTEETLLLRSGVVGGHLPPLQAAVLAVSPGDTLIFTTDGISQGFSYETARNQAPQKAAEGILARHFKGTDDALVLVVRYIGNRG